MAKNFIDISLSSRLSYKLRESVDQIARNRDLLRNIKADMDQMIDGSDYTMLEGAFGLPSGKGQSVYNLVAGALAELEADTNLNQLLSWLGAAY